MGRITTLGIPLIGSVPLSIDAVHDARGLFRWVTLGADATYVVLHENTDVLSGNLAPAAAAMYLTFEIDVFDLLMDGASPGAGTDDKYFEMTPTTFKARRGNFDSSFRYLRAGGGGFPVARGRSATIGVQPYVSAEDPTYVRYSVNGYVKTTAGNPATLNASITMVKK
jgi:hypothetical protein